MGIFLRRVLEMFATLGISFVAFSCMAPNEYVVQTMPVDGWTSPCRIEYMNRDTLSVRDLELVLRYNDRFRQDTLTVDMSVLSPDGRIFSERVLFRVNRTWTSAAVRHEEILPYRTSSRLGRSGYYVFTLTPCSPHIGIEAVGIHF